MLSPKELDLLQSLVDQITQIAQHLGLANNPGFSKQIDAARASLKAVREESATKRST